MSPLPHGLVTFRPLSLGGERPRPEDAPTSDSLSILFPRLLWSLRVITRPRRTALEDSNRPNEHYTNNSFIHRGKISPPLREGARAELGQPTPLRSPIRPSPLRSSRSQTVTMSGECFRWWMSHRLSVWTLCWELLSSDNFLSSADSEKADIAVLSFPPVSDLKVNERCDKQIAYADVHQTKWRLVCRAAEARLLRNVTKRDLY